MLTTPDWVVLKDFSFVNKYRNKAQVVLVVIWYEYNILRSQVYLDFLLNIFIVGKVTKKMERKISRESVDSWQIFLLIPLFDEREVLVDTFAIQKIHSWQCPVIYSPDVDSMLWHDIIWWTTVKIYNQLLIALILIGLHVFPFIFRRKEFPMSPDEKIVVGLFSLSEIVIGFSTVSWLVQISSLLIGLSPEMVMGFSVVPCSVHSYQ